MRYVLFLFLFFAAQQCLATTFGLRQQNCPVCDQPTTVTAVMSYGSYIYHWDSKYDLVYFPFTGSGGFWNCENCGYVMPSSDFLGLPAESRDAVRAHLETIHTDGEELSFADKMERARVIAKVMGRDDGYFAWYNRVMICNYREIDMEKAIELAREEIALLESGKGELPAYPKSRLYLLGEYHRMIGENEKAVQFLEKSIETPPVDYDYATPIVMGVLCVALTGILIFIIRRKSGTRTFRILTGALCLLLLILTALMGVVTFGASDDAEGQNEYYSQIARDRLEMMAEAVSPD